VSRKEIGLREARAQLGDLVNEAEYAGKATILMRNGRPAAAIVPVTLMKQETPVPSTVATDADELITFCRARMAETTSPLAAAMNAAWPGLPAGISLDEAQRRTSAALAAAGITDSMLILRQTITLYEKAVEMVEWLRANHPDSDGRGHLTAAESYLNVIRLHAAQWDRHTDYQPGFHHEWMDELDA